MTKLSACPGFARGTSGRGLGVHHRPPVAVDHIIQTLSSQFSSCKFVHLLLSLFGKVLRQLHQREPSLSALNTASHDLTKNMLSAKVVSSRIARTKTRCGQIIPPQVPTPKHRRSVVLRAAGTSENNISDAFSPSRRTILVSVPAALVLSGITGQLPSWAAGEYKTFLGYNQVQSLPTVHKEYEMN